MTMEKKIHEIWLPIPGYEYYEASDQQRIRSVDKVVRHNYGGNAVKKGRILSQHINSNGYKSVGLWVNGICTKTVHRLIALAFISNPEHKSTVNHKDGDKLNNAPSNLEWATQSENVQHAWDTGLNGHFVRSHAQNTFGIEAARKPITTIDFRTRDEMHFGSVSECAKGLGVTQSCISQALIRGTRVQRKFNVLYSIDKTKLPTHA